jgi:hypothetical protein
MAEVRGPPTRPVYLLGSFTEFHRLGGFHRLTMARRVFGQDRVR